MSMLRIWRTTLYEKWLSDPNVKFCSVGYPGLLRFENWLRLASFGLLLTGTGSRKRTVRNVFSMTQSDTMDTMPANSVKLLGDSQEACNPNLIRYPRRLPHNEPSSSSETSSCSSCKRSCEAFVIYVTECCLRPEKISDNLLQCTYRMLIFWNSMEFKPRLNFHNWQFRAQHPTLATVCSDLSGWKMVKPVHLLITKRHQDKHLPIPIHGIHVWYTCTCVWMVDCFYGKGR